MSKRFTGRNGELIELENSIIAEYQDQGIMLTIRQLHNIGSGSLLILPQRSARRALNSERPPCSFLIKRALGFKLADLFHRSACCANVLKHSVNRTLDELATITDNRAGKISAQVSNATRLDREAGVYINIHAIFVRPKANIVPRAFTIAGHAFISASRDVWSILAAWHLNTTSRSLSKCTQLAAREWAFQLKAGGLGSQLSWGEAAIDLHRICICPLKPLRNRCGNFFIGYARNSVSGERPRRLLSRFRLAPAQKQSDGSGSSEQRDVLQRPTSFGGTERYAYTKFNVMRTI
ncbi:hypothetical protein GBZ26_04460 [Azospirillum formosense]|uniref:Uncharacterized protein n=1 Tax=Azospirillum formosense TaxID=861533 RepID=A0ABX2KPB8_9PROT|nr:hypothetical protein [Azospirillum formosense]